MFNKSIFLATLPYFMTLYPAAVSKVPILTAVSKVLYIMIDAILKYNDDET